MAELVDRNSEAWRDYYNACATLAKRTGEWAGIPVPIKGVPMTIADGYRFKPVFDSLQGGDGYHECSDSDINEDVEIRNSWLSIRYKCEITIWREGKKFSVQYHRSNSGGMLVNTLGACRMWDPQSEIRALVKLRDNINQWQYDQYFLTGMFLESSKRSGVTYLFRRLRPTVAMTAKPNHNGRDVGMRILCTLCLHPIGYATDSFAGAMVPTDDLLAHLLLMRADEKYYWRKCNQHPAWAPESGL